MAKNRRLSLIILVFITITIALTAFLSLQKQELRKKAATGVTLSLVPSISTVPLGDSVQIAVNIDTAGKLVTGAELHLKFDPAYFDGISMTAGPFLPTVVVPGTITSGAASIILLSDPSQPKSGTGTLAILTLRGKQVTSQPSQITFETTTAISAADQPGVNVLANTVPTSVSVTSLTGVTLSLDPSTQTVAPNQLVTLNVLVNSAKTIAGVEIHISYDPTLLDGVSFTNGTFLNNAVVPGTVTNGSADITLLSDPTQPKAGNGVLAILTLRAKALTSSTSVQFKTTTAISSMDQPGVNVLTATVPATITIASITPSPTLIPSSTPAPTSSPGTGALRLQYYSDPSAVTATIDQIQPDFNIVNTGSTSVPLTELAIRYYFTRDSSTQQFATNCWYTDLPNGCGSVLRQVVVLPTPVNGADAYLEVTFTSGSVPANGQTNEILVGVHKSDWSLFDQSNDYSFRSSSAIFTDWDHVTLYRNGALVWGTPPNGIQPQPSVSPTPGTGGGSSPTPTTTPRTTATPTPTPRPTASPTATPRPTATPTATPRPTPTVTPSPTATALPTPTASPILSGVILRLRFLGVDVQTADRTLNVKVVPYGLTTSTLLTVPITSDSTGLFSNPLAFGAFTPGQYVFYMRDAMHLTRKVGPVNLVSGVNTIDVAAALIPGDIDHNELINIFDYSFFVAEYGPRIPISGSLADFDFDHDVDIYDYSFFVQNFAATGEIN